MPDPTETDFELVKYERDREHELALNEFTHNLEVEQLKLLILLNGGAATALLTFAEHSAASTRLLMFPVAVWLVGLAAGALATLRMGKAQAGYGKYYRHRRQVTEFVRLAGRRTLPLAVSAGDREALQAFVTPPQPRMRAPLWAALPGWMRKEEGTESLRQRQKEQQAAGEALASGDDPVALHASLADLAIRQAHARNARVDTLRQVSLWCFIGGAAFAAGVMFLSAPPGETTSRVEITSSTPAR